MGWPQLIMGRMAQVDWPAIAWCALTDHYSNIMGASIAKLIDQNAALRVQLDNLRGQLDDVHKSLAVMRQRTR